MSYADLINIDDFGEKRDTFNQERGYVSFFCKDCNKMTETSRPDENGYIFICKVCNGKNIAIGTYEGIKSNYRIK